MTSSFEMARAGGGRLCERDRNAERKERQRPCAGEGRRGGEREKARERARERRARENDEEEKG